MESYPNWTYSVALANWELEEIKKEGHENSSSMLSAAIRMYPCAVPLIYDKAALNDPQMSSNAFFKPPPVGSPLEIRVQVFVEKHHSLWKMSDALSWLRSQVSKVIALPHISNAPELSKWPQKLESSTVSMSVVRHIVVSDMASLLGCIRTLAPYQVLAYDPVPPATATRSVYDDFLEAQQSQNPLSNASILSALVQSLLPWQGPEGLPDAGFNAHRLEQRQVDEALNVAENAVPELFAPGQEAAGASWLQSLRGALNGLLGQTDDVSDDDEEDEIFVDAQEGPAEQ